MLGGLKEMLAVQPEVIIERYEIRGIGRILRGGHLQALVEPLQGGPKDNKCAEQVFAGAGADGDGHGQNL